RLDPDDLAGVPSHAPGDFLLRQLCLSAEPLELADQMATANGGTLGHGCLLVYVANLLPIIPDAQTPLFGYSRLVFCKTWIFLPSCITIEGKWHGAPSPATKKPWWVLAPPARAEPVTVFEQGVTDMAIIHPTPTPAYPGRRWEARHYPGTPPTCARFRSDLREDLATLTGIPR